MNEEIPIPVMCSAVRNILDEKILEGGQALIALDTYDFSDKFAWVNDRFGISWQLNFSKE